MIENVQKTNLNEKGSKAEDENGEKLVDEASLDYGNNNEYEEQDDEDEVCDYEDEEYPAENDGNGDKNEKGPGEDDGNGDENEKEPGENDENDDELDKEHGEDAGDGDENGKGPDEDDGSYEEDYSFDYIYYGSYEEDDYGNNEYYDEDKELDDGYGDDKNDYYSQGGYDDGPQGGSQDDVPDPGQEANDGAKDSKEKMDLSGLDALQALALEGEVVGTRMLEESITEATLQTVNIRVLSKKVPRTKKGGLRFGRSKPFTKILKVEKKMKPNRHLVVRYSRKTNKDLERARVKNKKQGNENKKQNKIVRRKQNQAKRMQDGDLLTTTMKPACTWRYICKEPDDLDSCRLHTSCLTEKGNIPKIDDEYPDHKVKENNQMTMKFRKMLGITALDEEVEKIIEHHILLVRPENFKETDKIETLAEYFNKIMKSQQSSNGDLLTTTMKPACTWRYICKEPDDLDSCRLHTSCLTEKGNIPKIDDEYPDHKVKENNQMTMKFRKMLGITALDEEVEKIKETDKIETLAEYFNKIMKSQQSSTPIDGDDVTEDPGHQHRISEKTTPNEEFEEVCGATGEHTQLHFDQGSAGGGACGRPNRIIGRRGGRAAALRGRRGADDLPPPRIIIRYRFINNLTTFT
uniref:Uncharacterized protein n=1 Tax=Heliothis virescens TaxID=7102 RepID=A0A2A4JYY7_HELVI